MPRKRTHDEMVASEPSAPPQQDEMLHKIRNMWEFAALYEFINIFGHAVKIQPVDIEDLETECTKAEHSHTIEQIGFQLLKFVSSRRDLTLENWDKTVRTQYEYKAQHQPHPYGNEEEPNKFTDFHIFTKLRVLYRLCQWTFWNPDNMKKALPQATPLSETDQFLDWQAHACGWDRHDRVYYKLSGNRLYRRTDPPIPEPAPKVKAKYTSKKAQAQRRRERSGKRRKVESEDGDTEMGDVEDTITETQLVDDATTSQSIADADPEKLNTFGHYKWECVAITLDEYNNFVATIAKSKDANEKNLKAAIEAEMIPELAKQEERRQRKIQDRLRQEHLESKMAGAKRSGRLAAKQEREREEAEVAEAERQKQTLLAAARRDQEDKDKMENERQSRMLTREQRIKEREYKRILLEEELARDSEEEKKIEEGGVRGSRHLKERIEKRKKELEEIEDDDWTFDCSGCGQHGKNWDDGEHSIACERCNVWQHSKCLGFSKVSAESDDFQFVCSDCRRKDEEANRPRISLKFKVGQSSSPPPPTSPKATKREFPLTQKPVSVDVPSVKGQSTTATTATNGGYVRDGRFYPTSDHSRTPPPAVSQPPPTAQPSLPGYATKGFRQLPYMNGAQQPSNNFNSYPSQERGPGSGNAQNLHHAVDNVIQPSVHPQQQTHQSPPLPPTRPDSSHSQIQTPRRLSSHSQMNGHSSPVRQRIPSPMINRPPMSPTQGNPDVGPIAGVPGSSPLMQPASLATPYTNGNHTTGMLPQSTPNQQPYSQNSSFSASQQNMTQPVSGLSPTKQRISLSPLPQPTLVPRKSGIYTTPSSSFNVPASRTISGTPIFPPAENLAPSPQQLNREPVPTPSKQSSPYASGTSGKAMTDVAEQTHGPMPIGPAQSFNVDQQQEKQQQKLPGTVQ